MQTLHSQVNVALSRVDIKASIRTKLVDIADYSTTILDIARMEFKLKERLEL